MQFHLLIPLIKSVYLNVLMMMKTVNLNANANVNMKMLPTDIFFDCYLKVKILFHDKIIIIM